MDNLGKVMSSYQKDINRLKKMCNDYRIINNLRKKQITQFNNFIGKLLKEKRITKDEIKQFMERKQDVKKTINESKG
jgi:hypothetical protein